MQHCMACLPLHTCRPTSIRPRVPADWHKALSEHRGHLKYVALYTINFCMPR